MTKRKEVFKLTEEMLLGLMQGKDIHLHLNAHDEENSIEILFKGPFDGVFISHRELEQIRYDSEMGVLGVMERLQKESKIYKG